VTDAELEEQIEATRQIAMRENDKFRQREVFAIMAQLIGQRSPQRIHEMEVERGLLS
jgi:hypothetical protein